MPHQELSLQQPAVLVWVAALAFAAGLVRGYTGFGGPAIMVVVLTYWFAPVSVMGKVLVMDLMANVKLFTSVLSDVDWKHVLLLTGACILGIPVGLWALTWVADDVMQQFVALLALVCAAILLSGFRLKRPPGIGLSLTVGAISGVAMSGAGIALIAMTFLFSGPSSTRQSRANAVVWLFIVTFVILAGYLATGVLTLDDIWRAALMGLAYLGGAIVGARKFDQSAEATVRRAAVALLFVLALVGVIL